MDYTGVQHFGSELLADAEVVKSRGEGVALSLISVCKIYSVGVPDYK